MFEIICFILKIIVPAGRKAGKYLQKCLEKNHKVDIKALVQSLDFNTKLVRTLDECRRVLEACHSCQASNADQYWEVWSAFKEVALVYMTNAAGEPVARALVCPKNGTYAPCYGQMHYCLKARLEFAGVEEGELVSPERIEAILNQEKVGLTRPPKSRQEVETVIFVGERIEQLERTAQEYQAQAYEEYYKHYNRSLSFSYREILSEEERCLEHDQVQARMAALRERADRLLAEARRLSREKRPWDEWRRYDPPVVKHIPIREDWDYIAEDIEVEGESAFYLDSERRFLYERCITRKGWYPKKK
jgi:hypothetical protein